MSDGWIKWFGHGEPALPENARVTVKLRGGTKHPDSCARSVRGWRWGHLPGKHHSDIVAYKVVEQSSPGVLPADAAARKAIPVYSGFVAYFPDAIVAVAELSRKGNDQHNPGKPLHWDRSKSGDELDAEMRHMIDGVKVEFDTDGVRHKTKKAWRAMADLQKAIEESRK